MRPRGDLRKKKGPLKLPFKEKVQDDCRFCCSEGCGFGPELKCTGGEREEEGNGEVACGH